MRLQRDFEHRDRLVVAALEAFAERGYEQASLNAILDAAGMSKGQFYHHFGSKEGLYVAVVELLLHRKRAHFLANPVAPTGDLFDTLRAQLLAGRAFARDAPDLERFSRSFLRERGNPIHDLVMGRLGLDGDAGLRALVAAAHARGELRAGVGVDFARRAIVLVLEHVDELLGEADPEALERRIDEVIGLLRGGLGA